MSKLQKAIATAFIFLSVIGSFIFYQTSIAVSYRGTAKTFCDEYISSYFNNGTGKYDGKYVEITGTMHGVEMLDTSNELRLPLYEKYENMGPQYKMLTHAVYADFSMSQLKDINKLKRNEIVVIRGKCVTSKPMKGTFYVILTDCKVLK